MTARGTLCSPLFAAAALAGLLQLGVQAAADPAAPVEAGGAAAKSEIERFCSNIADAARDRRYTLQQEKLKTLKDEVDQRIAALETKRAEYEDWLKRRDDFLAKARSDLVEIYSNMRPDAAAERLAQVQADLAAAIMMKLEPRKAGVILNEMDTKAAARLTGIMADATRKKDPS